MTRLPGGGVITELDYKPKAFNLVNSLMRRKESYHEKLRQQVAIQLPKEEPKVKSIHDILVSKDKDLSELLFYDQYARNCLIDHFFSPITTLEEFSRLQYHEYGDFVTRAIAQKLSEELKPQPKTAEQEVDDLFASLGVGQ